MRTVSSRKVTTRRWAYGPPPVVFLLLGLPLVVELVGVFTPAAQGFGLSFTRWNGLGDPEFIGMANYELMFGDEVFAKAIGNTALWLLLFGGGSFAGGLGMALLLQVERRGVTFYRVALFLPVVFSFVVTALVWSAIFQPGGLLDSILKFVGWDSVSRVWLGDSDTAIFAVMAAALWRKLAM